MPTGHEERTVVIAGGEDPQSLDPALGVDDPLLPGTVFGDYKIIKKLGAGGCATVYLAEEGASERKVAIKILRREWLNSDEMIRRFLFEVHAANTVRHPSIVEIYSSGLLPDGRLYLSMEYVEGVNLLSFAKLHGRFSAQEALEVLEPICNALAVTHAAGIIHRDLKASNIVVRPLRPRHEVKLLDFGIAKFLYQDPNMAAITRHGTRVGTPCAMSPEQVRCEQVDARSDIYSLGVLLYGLLVGGYPFDDPDPTEVERMQLEEPPPRPSASTGGSPALDNVVLKAMEKERERRYPSVSHFLEALREAAKGDVPVLVDSSLPAVGLYVEARIAPAHQESMDDAMLDDLSLALDIAEQVMREGGFEVPLITGSSLLGIWVLSSDPEVQGNQYKSSLSVAAVLYDRLEGRPRRDARVHINVSLHLDAAAVNGSVGGRKVIGGAITRISEWAPQSDVTGLFVTPPYEQAMPSELTIHFEPYLKVH